MAIAVARYALAMIAAAPVALVGTILLTPLWRAVESKLRIESIGHSGPAGWCFVATYIAVALLMFFALTRVRRSPRLSSGCSG